MNEKFLIADFTIGDARKQVYMLNPGDHFAGFGGSSSGLSVRKTASLIVRETSQGVTADTEYDINKRDVWNRIFRAAHLAGYQS